MKKNYILIPILVFLTLSFFGQEMLVNGDFESWDDPSTPTGWDKVQSITQSTDAQSGTYSAFRNGGSGRKDLGQTISGIQAGESYTISLWYKVANGDGADARIWSYWKNGNTSITDNADELRGPAGYLDNNGGVWTEYTTTLVAPTGVDSFYFEVRSYDNSEVYWDNFSFVKNGGGGQPQPTVPSISTSLQELSLNYMVGSQSNVGSFTVQGSDLKGDVNLVAPSNFEISTDSNTGFTNSLTLNQQNGMLSSTTIYARLVFGLSIGGYMGDIQISSVDSQDVTVFLTGNVYGTPTRNLVITGVFDGPLPGGSPKGVELYAIADIPDLSRFGLSSANNGGGSTAGTIEFHFPSVSVTLGTYIYVTSHDTEFTDFFGSSAQYMSSAVSINGDDAIELYEEGQIIDVFGDVDVDGTGTNWEYTDGWAYRNSNTGPENTFTESDWTYSKDVFDGFTTNSSATNPFPIGTYAYGTASLTENSIVDFTVYPNPVLNGKFVVSSKETTDKKVYIFNIMGQKVLSVSFNGTYKEINTSSLRNGIYIVKITENGKAGTKKLIIE